MDKRKNVTVKLSADEIIGLSIAVKHLLNDWGKDSNTHKDTLAKLQNLQDKFDKLRGY